MDTIPQDSKFKVFISKIFELPLWMKQVLYIELKEQIELTLSQVSPSFVSRDECFQLYFPKITLIGKKELETRSKELIPNVYRFLEGAVKNQSIVEITINNAWSLAECAVYFIEAVRAELIFVPDSNCVKGTALYLSGFIRLGEYFVKLSKISIEQLDSALRTQQHIEASTGEKKGMGEILLNSGLVSKADIESILYLKDESKKRHLFNINVSHTDSSELNSDDILKLKERISVLTKENQQLREHLRKILNVDKK